ncbi:MAG: hypothetical protein ACLQBL_33600 [Polyangiaceae bacterium]
MALLGGAGAVALGAGFWAQWGRVFFTGVEDSLPFGWWLLAGGAVVLGVAIWVGTSGDPLIRVGDGGIGTERGGLFGTQPLQRIPWHGVESIAYDGESGGIAVRGRDETGGTLVVLARLKSHPQAAAWIVREARARIPKVANVGDEITLPEARTDAGESLTLDPVQVVGKRCAASGTIIAFEPDARVCPRCERVYHKAHVPPTCECGGALASAPADEGKREPEPEPEAREASPA